MYINKVLNSDSTMSDKEIISNAVSTLTGDKARWVLWRNKEIDGSTKKVPYTRGNQYANPTNRDTWLPYKEVHAAQNDYDGIGLMLDGSVLGIDLDHCLENGEINDPLVKTLIDVANTYTEVSPSGTGIHLLFKLTAPLKLQRNRHESYEIYIKDRYLTFTGNLFNQNVVREINAEEAESLFMILGYPWQSTLKELTPNGILSPMQPITELGTVKEKMFSSKNGVELKRLYDGDTSSYGGDTSRADAALCANLAYWTNGHHEAVKSLWLGSGLAQRDKTQLREDYVERTVSLALSNSSNSTSIPDITATGPDSNNNTQSKTSMNPGMVFAEQEIDLEDLLKMNIQTEWDIEQLVTKGSLNMIASAPHQGKTFMALHIAICVANGIPVFGRFKVKETKNVLIVNEEDVLADIKGRLESMVPSERKQKKIKVYSNTGMKVSNEWVDGLLERAKKHDAGLIILDSLAALSLANENEAQAMQQVMDYFRRIVNTGITVIFIHHDRKGGQSPDTEGGSAMDKARGSSAITAAVHGYLSIKEMPGKQFRVTQVKLKANVSKIKPFTIQMHQDLTKDKTFHYKFEYVGEYNSDATAQDGIEERITRICSKHEEFIFTRKTLVEHGVAASPDDKTLRKSLGWMIQKGLLESCKYGDLPKEKQVLVQDVVQRGNTWVYIPTKKLLIEANEDVEDTIEDEVDDLGIPF